MCRSKGRITYCLFEWDTVRQRTVVRWVQEAINMKISSAMGSTQSEMNVVLRNKTFISQSLRKGLPGTRCDTQPPPWRPKSLNTKQGERLNTTHPSGKITPQAALSTRHCTGTNPVERTTIPARTNTDTDNENQYRFKILGTSLKKLDRSTSLTVAAQVIL